MCMCVVQSEDGVREAAAGEDRDKSALLHVLRDVLRDEPRVPSTGILACILASQLLPLLNCSFIPTITYPNGQLSHRQLSPHGQHTSRQWRSQDFFRGGC